MNIIPPSSSSSSRKRPPLGAAGDEDSQEDEEEEEEDRKPAAVVVEGSNHNTTTTAEEAEEDEKAEDSSEEAASPTRKRRRKSHGAGEAANSPVASLQDKWDDMFGRLLKFKEKYGHCLVPNRYKEDPSLGSWVATQRRTYKMLTSGGVASSGMNIDRARRLMEIGFEWETSDPRHVPWEERYEELKDFVATNGHSEVPMRWEENVQLSNWVSKQRQDYKLLKQGKTTRLTEKRRKLLNDLGFVWEIPRKGRRLRGAKPINPIGNSASNSSATNTNTTGNSPIGRPNQLQAATAAQHQQQQQPQTDINPNNPVAALQAALSAALNGNQAATPLPVLSTTNNNTSPVNQQSNIMEAITSAIRDAQQGGQINHQNQFNNNQTQTQPLFQSQQPQTAQPNTVALLLSSLLQGQGGDMGANDILRTIIMQSVMGQPQQFQAQQQPQPQQFQAQQQPQPQQFQAQQQQPQPQAPVTINLASLAGLLGGQQNPQQMTQQSSLHQSQPLNPSVSYANSSSSSHNNQRTSQQQQEQPGLSQGSAPYAGPTAQQQQAQQVPIFQFPTNSNQQQQAMAASGTANAGSGSTGGYLPTFILLPMSLMQSQQQAQHQQYYQPQQQQPQQPQQLNNAQQPVQSQNIGQTAGTGPPDWNALAGMGITRELLASFGLTTSGNPLEQFQHESQGQNQRHQSTISVDAQQRGRQGDGRSDGGHSEQNDPNDYAAV